MTKFHECNDDSLNASFEGINSLGKLTKDIFSKKGISTDSILFDHSIDKIEQPFTASIMEILNKPIDSPTIREIARKCKNGYVSILIDDHTRFTPTRIFLPYLFEAFSDAGISRDQIKLVVALGSHEPNPEALTQKKLGNNIAREYEIIYPNVLSAKDYFQIGRTAFGSRVSVHRSVLEADVRISIGGVVPHVIAGWSGGAKILAPGVTDLKTNQLTHLLPALSDDCFTLPGNPDNFVRKEMEQIGHHVGLDLIINVVHDCYGNIINFFCGDMISSHRIAVNSARYYYLLSIPTKVDLLIADAWPLSLDYWQCVRAFCNASLACKENGAIVFVTKCSKGLSGGAPIHGDSLRKIPELNIKSMEVKKALLDPNPIGLGTALLHKKYLGLKQVFCVSPGLSTEDCHSLGFVKCSTVPEAICEALGYLSSNDILSGVISSAGVTLPVVGHLN